MRGLKMYRQLAELFANGYKTWEVRSTNTHIREKVGIVASNEVLCTADLVDCFPVTKELYNTNFAKHRIACPFESLPEKYKHGYFWVFDNVVKCTPVKVKTKQGTRVWAELDPEE